MNTRQAGRRPGLAFLVSLACAACPTGCASESEPSAGAPAGAPAESTIASELSGECSPRSPAGQRSRTDDRPAGLVPSFRTIGRASGLDFERDDDIRGLHRIIESTGGGVGLLDFDADGRLDVFLTNGCRLPLRRSTRDAPCALFRNRGDLRFREVTGRSRLVQYGYTHGCAAGDYDADGFDDLYVTAFGRNALWRNNGDGTFAKITDETGTTVPSWSSSAAFADANGDGHLDLYVVNYLDESAESPTLCRNRKSPDGYEQCPPSKFEGVDDAFFLSDGRGGFIDATTSAGMSGLRGKGLGVVIADLGGTERPEIYVANDGQPNFLFVPRPDPDSQDEKAGSRERRAESGRPDSAAAGRAPQASTLSYEEQALSSGVALNESGYAQASMGIAAGDYDADGIPDLFLTHFFGDTNTLYNNRGDLQFQDATRGSNLGATSRRTLGWGTIFFDVDNDGRLDLFVANGHVDDRTWKEHEEPYRMQPQMYRNERDGSFADVSAWSGDYFREEWLGRGAAVGDLDRDGRPDLVVSHQLAPSCALRNETPTSNAALVLRLVGTQSNRNGYGARVEVVERGRREGRVEGQQSENGRGRPSTRGLEHSPLVRQLIGGGSFQSASAREVHLGMGRNRRLDFRIHWPSGVTDTYEGVSPGTWSAVEGQSLANVRKNHQENVQKTTGQSGVSSE